MTLVSPTMVMGRASSWSPSAPATRMKSPSKATKLKLPVALVSKVVSHRCVWLASQTVSLATGWPVVPLVTLPVRSRLMPNSNSVKK